MKYFPITDHERDLYLVVEICPGACGWITATTTDHMNACKIAELLNKDLAAPRVMDNGSAVDPPPCPPVPENDNPETEPDRLKSWSPRFVVMLNASEDSSAPDWRREMVFETRSEAEAYAKFEMACGKWFGFEICEERGAR